MYTFFDNYSEETEFLSFLKRGMVYDTQLRTDYSLRHYEVLQKLAKDPKVSSKLKSLIESHSKNGIPQWEDFWQDKYFPPICTIMVYDGFRPAAQLLALAGFESKL
jgi:hypothetical protein